MQTFFTKNNVLLRVPLGIWRGLSKSFFAFIGDACLFQAAALSFFTTLSLPALLSLFLYATSLILDLEEVRSHLVDTAVQALGEKEATLLQELLDRSAAQLSQSSFFSPLQLGSLVLAATAVFLNIRYALNTIWGVEFACAKNAALSWVIKRGLSIVVLLGVGVIFLFSLFISAVLQTIEKLEPLQFLLERLPLHLSLLHTPISFFLLWIGIALLYRWLPDAQVRFSFALRGSLLSTLLLVGGKELITWYVGSRSLLNNYGAARSLAALLLWLYLSYAIFLFGAEWVQQSARNRGIVFSAKEKRESELSS